MRLFHPRTYRPYRQKLTLTSDARQRFERGVDPEFLDDGLAIATKLVIDHCGGLPSAITRAGSPPVAPRNISYDPGYCLRSAALKFQQMNSVTFWKDSAFH